jgi:acyl-CoA thioester hydrolase
MNVAYYVLAFDKATDRFFDYIGVGDAYRDSTGCATFAAECHVTYSRELLVDDPLRITTQLLAHDEKRIHYFLRMYHEENGYVAASCEWISLHVNLESRRVTPLAQVVRNTLAEIARTHSLLEQPDEVGHVIGVPSGRYQR